LATVKTSFAASVSSAVNLYAAVTPYVKYTPKGFDENPLHPKQARRVVGLAFLSLVAAWEDFVQAVFIRYMAGVPSPGGYRPDLRLGPCGTLRHAAEILTGRPGFDLANRYLSWTKWSEVTSLASLHFVKGRPFSNINTDLVQALNDGHVIRNRVAHSSRKAREDFLEVARRFLGLAGSAKTAQGYDVGTLLLETNVRGFAHMDQADDYFLQYCRMYVHLSDIVCP
jgi:hypothetical protein